MPARPEACCTVSLHSSSWAQRSSSPAAPGRAPRLPPSRLVSLTAPIRVAVVGSGPAGFYAADALLKNEDPPVEVDVLDRLPTPWGLVRFGVAPDHENIKAVSRAFQRTAARPGFRFF